MQQPAPRSRRGAPVIASGPTESFKVEASLTNPSSASAISSSNPQFLEPDPVLPKAEQPWLSSTPAQPQPASMASMVVPSQPSMGMATSVSPSTISANNTANDQLRRQMDTFEREQQQKFMREIEEHKRQLEQQQKFMREIE